MAELLAHPYDATQFALLVRHLGKGGAGMSQTKLPQDPEGGQHYPTGSPQPQLRMERAGRAGAPQERETAPRAGVGQHYARAAIRSIALDQSEEDT